jgi:protein associated with RNAse G/E
MSAITVIKKDFQEQEVWRYTGKLRERGKNFIILEANFNRADMLFHGMHLGQGDRFVETFYTDRWYNIFEIHDRNGDHFKGWYCNIGRPALIEGATLSYIDLALDLLVFPDGRQIVLDEDEFEALPLEPETRAAAQAALEDLRDIFKARFSMEG